MVFTVLYQQADGIVINVDRPNGIFDFRFRHTQPFFAPGDGLRVRQALLFGVQVRPEECHQLASLKASAQLQTEHQKDAVPFRRLEVVPYLFWRNDSRLSRAVLPWFIGS